VVSPTTNLKGVLASRRTVGRKKKLPHILIRVTVAKGRVFKKEKGDTQKLNVTRIARDGDQRSVISKNHADTNWKMSGERGEYPGATVSEGVVAGKSVRHGKTNKKDYESAFLVGLTTK